MASLKDFLREMEAAHQEDGATVMVEVVSDNARVPTERLRGFAKLVHLSVDQYSSSIDPLSVCDQRSTIICSAASSRSPRGAMSRYNSEPIQLSTNSIPARKASVTATVLGRWVPIPLSPCDRKKRDKVLVVPQRSQDSSGTVRWGNTMSRNHSDSALLSILPKRTHCMPVSKIVLSTFKTKCSAAKVMLEIAHDTTTTSRRRHLDEATLQEDNEPFKTKRREQESKERFIRSILDISGAIHEEETVHDVEEEEVEALSPRCMSTRKIVGGVQAIMGFCLLVIQIISVELLGPVVLNANSLLQALAKAIPDSEEKGKDLVLPLFEGRASAISQQQVVSAAIISMAQRKTAIPSIPLKI